MLKKYNLIMVIVIVLLATLNFHQCSSKKDIEKAAIAAAAEAEFWRDKNNHSNAEILVLKADKELIKKTNADLVDSLKKENIKLKNTKSVVTITKHTTDTVKVDKPRFEGPWFSYQWLDKETLAFFSKDSIALITHEKKYGFLNLRSKYVTRAISYNPNTILTGITSVEIVPKRRKLGLGLYVGYGATISQGIVRAGPQVGFGIQIRL